MAEQWIQVCEVGEIDELDVIRFDHSLRTYAVYRASGEKYYATDGLCTHGNVHLADGLVIDHLIECPKHNGRFDYASGQPKRTPVCTALKTYPVKIEEGKVLIFLSQTA